MRHSISIIAAALLLAAGGSAFAAGGVNSDRGDTNPLVTGRAEQVQVETASQTADAGGYVESLR
jgi:uncharacterized protein YxeA